jgi:nitrogen regulatory protein PII
MALLLKLNIKPKIMKAVFIAYNQALSDRMDNALKVAGIKGFSKWTEMLGVGSNTGEPHLGTHTWPSMNSGILTIVEDEKVDPLLNYIRQINKIAEEQGIHAFVWDIERMV